MQHSRHIFLDLETTGLEDGDEITEAGWILDTGKEFQAFVEHDKMPNKWVLEKTDYIERILRAKNKISKLALAYSLQDDVTLLKYVGMTTPIGDGISKFTLDWKPNNVYMVGANPSFDDRFLRSYFAKIQKVLPYNYHLICIETYIAGILKLNYIPHLKDLRGLLGLQGQNEAPHTALADAKEVKYIWDWLHA